MERLRLTGLRVAEIALEVVLARTRAGQAAHAERSRVGVLIFRALRYARSSDSERTLGAIEFAVEELVRCSEDYGSLPPLVRNERDSTSRVSAGTSADGTSSYMFDVAALVAGGAVRPDCDELEATKAFTAAQRALACAQHGEDPESLEYISTQIFELRASSDDYEPAVRMLVARGEGVGSPTSDPRPRHWRCRRCGRVQLLRAGEPVHCEACSAPREKSR